MEHNLSLVIHNVTSIISIIALCGMALFLFLNGKGKTLNKVLGTTVLFVLVYVISHVVGVNIQDPNSSMLVLMFNLSVLFIGSTNVHAVLALTKEDQKYQNFIIFLYFASALLVTIFIIYPSLFLLPSVSKMHFANYYVPGAFNWVRIVFVDLICVPYMIYKLVAAYRRSNVELDRNRYKYFAIIILVAYTIGMMADPLVYNIPLDPSWGMSFAFTFSIPFLYAGIKYELFNIKIIAKQAFYYALSIGVIGGVITLLNYSHSLLQKSYPEYPSWVTALISAVLFVSVSIIAWRNLRKTDLLRYEFITTVTHKFRTPLTAIKWAADDLSGRVESKEDREQIEYIKNSTEKLALLTDLLVTTSETEAMSYKYVFTSNDLSEVAEQVLLSLNGQFQIKKIQVSKSLQPGLKTNFDLMRIKFVIQALIENSVHYTPAGGTVFVSTRNENGVLIFSVRDSGIGMNKEELELVFSKFYRSAEARAADTEGMGIGLFIAREIVLRHKGKIWAESAGLDSGSTFSFSLGSN